MTTETNQVHIVCSGQLYDYDYDFFGRTRTDTTKVMGKLKIQIKNDDMQNIFKYNISCFEKKKILDFLKALQNNTNDSIEIVDDTSITTRNGSVYIITVNKFIHYTTSKFTTVIPNKYFLPAFEEFLDEFMYLWKNL
jgi:hypothetical protein